MIGGWPAEGRLAGRSAASGRLVDGDEGDGSVRLTGEVVTGVGWRGEGLKEEKNNPGALGGCLAGKKMNSVGAAVFLVRRPIIMSKRIVSKFLSKWDDPYMVQEVYTNGAYKIVDENGLRIGPINGKFLKGYYA
uniref:Uncharacterized protein n=1 Tax=Populus alba TaxID=43335 RepID=A0A4U5PQC3_POPAL|nr:hypothetical protein D5086_0000192740 [Populus alba]